MSLTTAGPGDDVRVCVVSHRLGGMDGVSVEAAKWVDAFRALGWEVTRAAGHFADSGEPGDVRVRGLWAAQPGEEPPPVDQATIAELCRAHDLLVLDNAGSLWSAPLASVAFEHHALAARIPTIARHHDPAWQGIALRTPTPDTVPLHHPAFIHVLINELTREEFAHRWPELAVTGALQIVYNRVSVDAFADGARTSTRRLLGVGPRELLLVHPARVEALNKNIPGAVEFARRLEAVAGRTVRYWLTDPDCATDPEVTAALAVAPGLLRGRAPSQADMYAAADLVLLPSTWEGWGLPVIEGAAAQRPIVAGPYPVLDEIRALGLRVYDPAEVDEVGRILTTPGASRSVIRANTAAVAQFDTESLPGELARLARAAAQRMAA